MCAILGGSYRCLTADDIQSICRLFEHSQIRGKHATGISYCDGDSIRTIKYPIPGKEFINSIDLTAFIGKEFAFIGHCRYSTSDLEYNQPIADDDLAIVHNGVITQEPFETWQGEFTTKNDSEFVFKSHKTGSNPILDFPGASLAVCGLTKNDIFFYRNGKRPLHYCLINDNLIISSTYDIIVRSGICASGEISKAVPGFTYSFDRCKLDLKELQEMKEYIDAI